MRLYLKFFSIHVKSEMAYPGSFFLGCAGRVMYLFATIFSVFLLMGRFGEVGGHTIGEILLGYGVITSSYNIAECFARGFDMFGNLVREGKLDRLMVRPKGLVFQVICQDLRLVSVSNILAGLAIIVYAISISEIMWTLGKALVLLCMIFCGSMIFFGVYLVYAAMCFVTLEGLEFINIFTDGIREYSRYPFDIYGKGVLFVTTAIMPVALVQYWPLRYLLGQAPAWYGLLPLLSLWFLLPCYAAWRAGLRRYHSSGS